MWCLDGEMMSGPWNTWVDSSGRCSVNKSVSLISPIGIHDWRIPLAYERQAHQARLRNEITRAKTEQNEYLKNVELARTLEKRKAKKAAVGEPLESAPNQDAHSRSYKQRKVVEKPKTLEGQGMDGVLDNIFG